MSLLTPSESHAFQSFLSSVDSSQASQEWVMYSTQEYNNEIPMQGSESLARATKDLMSLDAERWAYQQQQQQQTAQYDYSHQQHQYGRLEAHYPHQKAYPNRRNVTFPFLEKHSQHARHSHLQIASPIHDSYSSLPTPSTASSSSSVQRSPPSPPRKSVSPGLKRPLDSGAVPISKRSRASPPLSYAQSSPSPSMPTPVKPALLSPSQKKANHIQSEQKRRANIRRGYEALCETVPSLREAIRAEELSQGTSNKGRGKKPKSRGKTDEATGEKIDGRAGPRSENVVLMKTIEYINELHSERSQLLLRLQAARAALPSGHPALVPPISQPLWEREWKGGSNKDETECDDEDDGE